MEIIKQAARTIFSKRWLIATGLVVFGTLILVRLGIWQLDRLEARRDFNARVSAQIDLPPLELTPGTDMTQLADSEYRQVVVSGSYDFLNEVALINQAYQNEWGAHLLTPLHIGGSDETVMVDRGFIPGEDYQSGDWSKYRQPGEQTITGILRRSKDHPDFGVQRDRVPLPGEPPLKTWTLVNLDGIAGQLPYPILDVYIQREPDGSESYPIPVIVKLELSEGPHQGYAIQWFTYAGLLLIGYPFFVYRREKRE